MLTTEEYVSKYGLDTLADVEGYSPEKTLNENEYFEKIIGIPHSVIKMIDDIGYDSWDLLKRSDTQRKPTPYDKYRDWHDELQKVRPVYCVEDIEPIMDFVIRTKDAGGDVLILSREDAVQYIYHTQWLYLQELRGSIV